MRINDHVEVLTKFTVVNSEQKFKAPNQFFGFSEVEPSTCIISSTSAKSKIYLRHNSVKNVCDASVNRNNHQRMTFLWTYTNVLIFLFYFFFKVFFKFIIRGSTLVFTRSARKKPLIHKSVHSLKEDPTCDSFSTYQAMSSVLPIHPLTFHTYCCLII